MKKSNRKLLKDAEPQTIEFDYMFQTSRYQAPNKDFFDIDVMVRFYTELLTMQTLMVVFEHASWHVMRKHSHSRDLKSLLLHRET